MDYKGGLINMEAKYYQLQPEEVFRDLQSQAIGLEDKEAKERLEKYGYNELKAKRKNSFIRFLRQFHNPLIYVLLIASLICTLLTVIFQEHMWNEVAIILLVVVANTIIGFIQEGKAEKALEALKKMMVLECTVIRDGKEIVIPSRELVPGDIVLLKSGDKIPADLRLFYAKNLTCDESVLTGESTPVEKDTEAIKKENVPIAEQTCMAFSGTFVTLSLLTVTIKPSEVFFATNNLATNPDVTSGRIYTNKK